MRVGVVSDTHGLLRPEVLTTLAGADHILHAGDVGDPTILERLAALAPLTAIRGNIDTTGPCAGLPAAEAVELGGRLFYLVHALADLDLSPRAAGIRAVISGHSHKPSIETRNGVLYLNPGSAGPRRFSLPITLAWLTLRTSSQTDETSSPGIDDLQAEIVPLLPSAPGRSSPAPR